MLLLLVCVSALFGRNQTQITRAGRSDVLLCHVRAGPTGSRLAACRACTIAVSIYRTKRVASQIRRVLMYVCLLNRAFPRAGSDTNVRQHNADEFTRSMSHAIRVHVYIRVVTLKAHATNCVLDFYLQIND